MQQQPGAHPRTLSWLTPILALLATGFLGLWICTFIFSTRFQDFRGDARRLAIGDGFVYFKHDAVTDAARLSEIARVEDRERNPQPGDVFSSWSSSSGGSVLGLVNWGRQTQTSVAGPYSAIRQDRTIYWISPWLGIIPTALVFALIETSRYWQRRRVQRRVAKGCCPVCGYDLRATPEQCPECGATGRDNVFAE